MIRDLKHAAGAWVDELPSVLWGLRTTPNRSTGRTPFFLVYGAEAVLPSNFLHNAPRVELFSEEEAEQARQDAVDLLEEEREMALIRSTIYQQDLRRFHARNVRGRAFQEGDLFFEWTSRNHTSSLLLGKVLSSSPKFSTTERTIFTTSITRSTSHELGMRICSAPFTLKYLLG